MHFPDANVHAAARSETITPLQKLFVMNNAFVIEQAKRFATRITSTESDSRDRIRLAYELLFARPPNEIEIGFGMTFMRDDRNTWSDYAHALMATNEMMYLD